MANSHTLKRADHLTDAERKVMATCALCGEEAKGRRNEHLLFECTAASVVELRKEVEAAVEKKVSRLVKPGPVREGGDFIYLIVEAQNKEPT